jgi:predicted membrane-bound spermidine synthase
MQITKNISTGLVIIACLLIITGFLVAGIFAYTSLYEIEDQKIIISPLYSADLIGGCIGSILGSLILIPLMGMNATAWGMLLISVFSLILV